MEAMIGWDSVEVIGTEAGNFWKVSSHVPIGKPLAARLINKNEQRWFCGAVVHREFSEQGDEFYWFEVGEEFFVLEPGDIIYWKLEVSDGISV